MNAGREIESVGDGESLRRIPSHLRQVGIASGVPFPQFESPGGTDVENILLVGADFNGTIGEWTRFPRLVFAFLSGRDGAIGQCHFETWDAHFGTSSFP